MNPIYDFFAEQMMRAIEDCEARKFPVRVHEIRINLKGARALLRLLRVPGEDQRYRRADAALRDAGHQLDATRDAQALIAALDQRLGRGAGGALRRALLDDLKRSRHRLSPAVGATLARRLRALARRLRPYAHVSVGEAPRGLRRTYRRGRRAMRDAATAPSDAALHAWRKQAKYLARELTVLEIICGSPAAAHRRREARKLGAVLGEDHDLALLSARLKASRERAGVHRQLRREVAQRRSTLQRCAWRLGRRLYACSSARFLAQLKLLSKQ